MSDARRRLAQRRPRGACHGREFYDFLPDQKTVLDYTRYLELESGTDIEFFRALFTQELIDAPAYFND